MSNLLSPVTLGDLNLRNRVIMAPLTRCRASEGRVPNDLMKEYYVQRAGFGLIITEATSVTAMGVGYPDTPGIWSEEQTAGWKKITDAVHAAGGKIALQLWHVGRISDPHYLNGELPVAPSAITPSGRVSLMRPEKNYVQPRALELSEIPGIVEAYQKGAENAKKAGFDGVEIHGANGYLLDQFLQDHSNTRTDQYGGSIQNRARLMLEVTDAVISVWGAGKVGMHLAPKADVHDMGDSTRVETFTYVATELGRRKLAFLCTREGGDDRISPILKKAFGGALIANQGLTQATAEAEIKSGNADAAAFGVLAIANPDLVTRFTKGAPLNAPNPSTFYGKGPEGYTDYTFLNQ